MTGYQPQGDNRPVWQSTNADYSADDTALRIGGNPVMERWEEPFMAALAAVATSSNGRILEVGFGMGISASFVQQHDIDEHVIIEANDDVYDRLLQFADSASRKVTPCKGLWKDVISEFDDESFDGILYDTYPLSEDELHTHQFDFLREAWRLLRPGGVATYCNLTSWGNLKSDYPDDHELFAETQSPHLQAIGIQNFGLRVTEVNPPETCEYYRYTTAPTPVLRKD